MNYKLTVKWVGEPVTSYEVSTWSPIHLISLIAMRAMEPPAYDGPRVLEFYRLELVHGQSNSE